MNDIDESINDLVTGERHIERMVDRMIDREIDRQTDRDAFNAKPITPISGTTNWLNCLKWFKALDVFTINLKIFGLENVLTLSSPIKTDRCF